MSNFLKWLKWSLGPLQGFVPGLSSYRFFSAMESNPSKALRLVAKRRSLHALQQIETGFSPLHVAASKGNLPLMQAVLARSDRQEYVDLQNNQKMWTPLQCAVRNGSDAAVKLMLDAKANVHLRNKEGCSALHIAAGHGFLEVVKLLVNHGMLVDEADSANNWTPLHYSAVYGHLQLAQWLVSNGAKPGSTDKSEFTPMLLSILHSQQATFEYLFQFRDSFKSKSRVKAVHLAAQNPSSDILAYLHARGQSLSDIDHADTAAQAIHYAAYSRSVSNLQFLLDHGVDVNTQDASGCTALHLAVISQDLDAVALLCAAGANTEIANGKNLTARDIADSLNNKQVAMILRRAKATNS